LKIAKKIVSNYDGVFLISNPDTDETTVYLTLPLVPEHLPLVGFQLNTPTMSTHN
jgi:signal transduction histidine kinase